MLEAPRGERRPLKRFPLLKLDPELGRALPDSERRRAECALLVPTVTVPVGPWEAPREPPRGTELGLLVLEGQLIREVAIARSRSLELLGHGDLIRPWQEDACSFCDSGWRVLDRSRLAVLDDNFARALAQWPQLVTALIERTLRRSRFMAVEAAVSNVVGVEQRILSLFWQLAEKWGRREDDGVVVTIKLTHQLFADVVGARRPSVTQALGRLVEAGAVEARTDGCWLLKGQAPPSAAGDLGPVGPGGNGATAG